MTQGSYDVRRGSKYDEHKDLYKSVDDGYTGDDKGSLSAALPRRLRVGLRCRVSPVDAEFCVGRGGGRRVSGGPFLACDGPPLHARTSGLRMLLPRHRQAHIGAVEGILGTREIGFGLAAPEALLGALPGLLGARDIDVLGTLRGLGQDGHSVR